MFKENLLELERAKMTDRQKNQMHIQFSTFLKSVNNVLKKTYNSTINTLPVISRYRTKRFRYLL